MNCPNCKKPPILRSQTKEVYRTEGGTTKVEIVYCSNTGCGVLLGMLRLD